MPERLAERRFDRSAFDKFGEAASEFAGRGALFTGCASILVLWLASYWQRHRRRGGEDRCVRRRGDTPGIGRQLGSDQHGPDPRRARGRRCPVQP